MWQGLLTPARLFIVYWCSRCQVCLSLIAGEVVAAERGMLADGAIAQGRLDTQAMAQTAMRAVEQYRGCAREMVTAEGGSYSVDGGRTSTRPALGPVSLQCHDGAGYARAWALPAAPLLLQSVLVRAPTHCESEMLGRKAWPQRAEGHIWSCRRALPRRSSRSGSLGLPLSAWHAASGLRIAGGARAKRKALR